MATYKVIQDIEAEDKFLGPFTLKQFIFLAITFISAYLSFYFMTRGLWFLVMPLLPIMLVAGFLAFPWGRDQPTEIWLLAKLRFVIKPRRRIWDQSGIQELVTITAPKKVEQYMTNNLSQGEVKSRLKALAETIDSRGWAVKDANVNLFVQPILTPSNADGSDRLVSATTLPKSVGISDVVAADDMMDEKNNPTAAHLNQLIAASTTAHRKQTLKHMQDIREGHPDTATDKKNSGPRPDFWFMNQPDASQAPPGYAMFGVQTVLPGTDDSDDYSSAQQATAEEKKLLETVREQEETQRTPLAYGNTRVILPLSQQKKAKPAPAPRLQPPKKTAPPPVTPPPDPAIINLANNDDLSVATIAREANKQQRKEQPPDEVVISLH